MKTITVRITAMLVTYSLFAFACRAEETTYAQLIKERDSVLFEILAEREGKRASGIADEEAIAAAQIELYSFRRDVTKSAAEKIKNQELIIRIFETKLERVRGKIRAGLGANIHVLEARAQLLEAKQVLEELRMNENRG